MRDMGYQIAENGQAEPNYTVSNLIGLWMLFKQKKLGKKFDVVYV